MWKVRDPEDGDLQIACYLNSGERTYYAGVGSVLLNMTREDLDHRRELIKLSLLLPTELL